mgnify:CR=1 FL=1|jgi:hypothetical protein
MGPTPFHLAAHLRQYRAKQLILDRLLALGLGYTSHLTVSEMGLDASVSWLRVPRGPVVHPTVCGDASTSPQQDHEAVTGQQHRLTAERARQVCTVAGGIGVGAVRRSVAGYGGAGDW